MNGVTLLMQVETGSDVTLIPRTFWERMRRPKLKKSNLQFDGSVIKMLGCFEGTFETKKQIRDNTHYSGGKHQKPQSFRN